LFVEEGRNKVDETTHAEKKLPKIKLDHRPYDQEICILANKLSKGGKARSVAKGRTRKRAAQSSSGGQALCNSHSNRKGVPEIS